jgi:hypothetical protein
VSDTYVVVKSGAYLHGVWGPFASQGEAAVRAQALAAEDYDDYHDWDVCAMDTETGLGQPIATYKGPARIHTRIRS